MSIQSMDWLLRPPEDSPFEYPEDGETDWIDEALKKGFGFKSEVTSHSTNIFSMALNTCICMYSKITNQAEKQAYLDSLGDPMEHPLWAESAEDCKDHPLAPAFRALNEEDKTNRELAVMYKDEGNEWLKGGLKSGIDARKAAENIKEAGNCYTHALNFLEKAFEEGVDEDVVPEMTVFKSTIFGNRSQTHLHMKNYASCIRDAEEAVRLNPNNLKARYRKAKSLFLLRKYQLCIDESSALLELDGGNGEAAFLVEKSNQELVKIAHVVENARRLRSELEGSWKSAYGIAEDIGVKLGYTASNYLDFLPQLSSVEKLPRRDEEGQPIWPVLLLYPQYNQIDIIRGVSGGDMLAIHLAHMFPEQGEGEPISWDIYDEFHVSNLVAYYAFHSVPLVHSEEEWTSCCKEQADIHGVRGDEIADTAKSRCKNRIAAHQAKKDKTAGISDFVEVHLGCTFDDILRADGNVLPGGLLTLIVCVRENQAHEKFLRESKIKPNFVLTPR